MKERDLRMKFSPVRSEEGPGENDLLLTMEERIAMVWPLTVDAWAFKGDPVAEDFRDILSVFLEEGVEFLVVEGYAARRARITNGHKRH